LSTKCKTVGTYPIPTRPDLEILREKALPRDAKKQKPRRSAGSDIPPARRPCRARKIRTVRRFSNRDDAAKILNKILQEDPKLLMWYDQAVTRMGGE
jgi:hypothetical protein